jgi:hypothetical protein
MNHKLAPLQLGNECGCVLVHKFAPNARLLANLSRYRLRRKPVLDSLPDPRGGTIANENFSRWYVEQRQSVTMVGYPDFRRYGQGLVSPARFERVRSPGLRPLSDIAGKPPAQPAKNVTSFMSVDFRHGMLLHLCPKPSD